MKYLISSPNWCSCSPWKGVQKMNSSEPYDSINSTKLFEPPESACGEDICLQQRHGDWCEDLKPFHSNKCYPKCSEFDPRQCSISTTQLLKLWILGVHCFTTTTTTWTCKLKAPNVHNRILGWRRHFSLLDRNNNQASVCICDIICGDIYSK